jgi:hypothetical protein
MHYRGRYLLVQAIAGPVPTDRLVFIMEDEEGDAVQLELFHQMGPCVPQERMTKEMLPTGIFVVKERYYPVT